MGLTASAADIVGPDSTPDQNGTLTSVQGGADVQVTLYTRRMMKSPSAGPEHGDARHLPPR